MAGTPSFTIRKILSKTSKMLLLIIMICMAGCTKSVSDSNSVISNHLPANDKIIYIENWLELALDKEYSNYTVGQKVEGFFNNDFKNGTYNAYVLVSPIDSVQVCHNALLAIETASYVHFVQQPDFMMSYADSIYACDIDGDKIDEVILQQTIGASGGAGQYLSRVYKIEKNEVCELFFSSPINVFNTGFEFVVKDNYELQVQNRLASFKQIYNIKELKDMVLALYNKDGTRNINADLPYTDSFLSFLPKDIDSDGVFELECKQYVALYNHSNILGEAVTVLKYNQSAKRFEVVEANFFLEN